MLPYRAPAVLLLGAVVASAAAAPLRSAASGSAQPAGELLVTFLHTSDEHSAVLPAPLADHRAGAPDPTRGGFARLATAVEAQRAARSEPVLLTSAGDNIGGSPFAWLLLDGAAAELGLMVELGYDVVTPGNHEFDYDSDRLARYIAAAGYPAAAARTALVATNTRPPPGHALGELGLRRTHLVELPNGLRVGFFGLIGRGAARFATLAPPVEFTDARTEAAAAVAALRADGAHVVVAITHSGLREDRELARDVDGIDIILGGHDHLLLDEPLLEAGTVIVHPGAHLHQLAVLEIGYDTATGRVRVRNGDTGTAHVLPLDSTVAASAWMSARVDELRARLETRIAEVTDGRFGPLDETVARAAFSLRAGPPMQETPLGNFVTDAMRAAVEAATGERVDFAFQANGVIRSDVVPAGIPERAGDIVFHDVAGAVGMGAGPDGRAGYPLVGVWLTGDEVRRVLEVSVLLSELLRNSYYLQVSGLRMRYDRGRAILFRVPVRGTPIPSGRAVLAAERLANGEFVAIERGDTSLYHVVTDYYVASFLPMVGRMLPRLAFEPKDRDGNAIDIDDAIVHRAGAELKVWQAVLEYAAAQPPGADGLPQISERYETTEGRLVQARAMPLWVLPLIAVVLVAVGVAVLVRRRRGRAHPQAPT